MLAVGKGKSPLRKKPPWQTFLIQSDRIRMGDFFLKVNTSFEFHFLIKFRSMNHLDISHNTSIILIGYRGTGKTSIAELLAHRLDRPMIDSDVVIEQQYGKNISTIFAEHGESEFRRCEAETISSILSSSSLPDHPIVLSTGGGAILRAETRHCLRSSGHVIWLTARPETIFSRLESDSRSASLRPSLTALPAYEEILSLLQARDAFYRETAHQIVSTDSATPSELANEILCYFK